MVQITALLDRDEVLNHIHKVHQSFHIKAFDLPVDYPWLNVARPLSERDLRGKVILLDFWTYGRIKCVETIPDLKYLEHKFAGRPFAVIGVLVPKFQHERRLESIRHAIARDHLDHPIIVDRNFALWQAYGVHSWPTMVLIDPDGNIQTVFSGVGNRETIELYVDVLLEEYQKIGRLNHSLLPLRPETSQPSDSILHYPEKVLADSDRNWLLIADTGNHRILVTEPGGQIIHTIGTGREGFTDGPFQTAQFSTPRGMALYNHLLLVADSGNHAIRQIDFDTRQVRTLAGTGQQSHYYQIAGQALEIPLSFPWDLQTIGKKCFIAMAGANQIWSLDLETLYIEPYAGTGEEARLDGVRKRSAFAQPSGITADPEGRRLFIADSEVSSVRMIDLQQGGLVSTLVGGDLFDFGDEDGYGAGVRFQHPLGIKFLDGKLFLADTYNHKIKTIDPVTRTARSYLGSGKPGCKDGLAPQFHEPGGLTALSHHLYVADTNNHRIRVISLQTHEVKTLTLKNGHTARTEGPAANPLLPVSKIIHERPYPVTARGFILRVQIQLPPNQHFTPAASFKYLLIGDPAVVEAPSLNEIATPAAGPVRQFEIPVKLLVPEGQYQLSLQIQYFYCDNAPSGSCKMRTVEHQIPLDLHPSAQTEILIQDSP